MIKLPELGQFHLVFYDKKDKQTREYVTDRTTESMAQTRAVKSMTAKEDYFTIQKLPKVPDKADLH